MKKIFAVALIVMVLCCVFVGCGANKVKTDIDEDVSSMFVVIEESNIWYVGYHKDTKVMYTISRGMNNVGTFTLLVNPDGTPMIYEGR